MKNKTVKSLCLMLAIIVTSVSGCGSAGNNTGSSGDTNSNTEVTVGTENIAESAGNADNNSENENINTDDASGNTDDNTSGADEEGSGALEGDTSKDDSSIVGASSLSEEELNSPIEYTYQSHPMELLDHDKRYAMGNYYSFQLEKSDREKFSILQQKLDELSSTGEKDINDQFSSSKDEVAEIFESGWGIGYEFDHYVTPVRADGRVFSFVVLNYTYLAGAHGVADYTNYNFDPVTGEQIKFEDVVKSTDGLPEIIVSEIEKQNEDIADMFKEFTSDRENLLSGIPARFEENARGLAWTIDYDGIQINFEDYAMGSYAAGARGCKVKFDDYPEIFTDTYNNYKGTEIPNIKEIGKELKDADTIQIDANTIASTGDNSDDIDESSGEGEDWWYHAVVSNPGWSAWTSEGIETDAGTPSVELVEVDHTTYDWLNEDAWASEQGIELPRLPYSDATYDYSCVNDAEEGGLSLTVYNHETSTLNGNYYFDEFINPPDQGTGMFADFTEPEIKFAAVKDDILYVSIGHRTYASANPHTSYLIAIDTVSGKTLWRSDDQVCGSSNFIIEGDSIICGYGFTDEPDYIYIINRLNGKTQKQIKVKSSPYFFIPMYENALYVLTYNTEYIYRIDY